MEAASSAINKLLSGTGQQKPQDETVAPAAVDDSTTGQTTVEQEVAPAVEHEHVKKEHETREQTVVDRERHQDHYHTTIQPLKDQEVKAEKHDHTTAPTQYKEVNKDDADKVQAQVDADRSGFKSTSTEQKSETVKDEGTVVGEQVHHHLHETIQPVIEKETIVPSVTHKTIPVKEVIQEQSKNEGVTTNSAISVDEFAHRLDGGSKIKTTHDGAATTSSETAVTAKE